MLLHLETALGCKCSSMVCMGLQHSLPVQLLQPAGADPWREQVWPGDRRLVSRWACHVLADDVHRFSPQV
jgi:hypothetical protein